MPSVLRERELDYTETFIEEEEVDKDQQTEVEVDDEYRKQLLWHTEEYAKTCIDVFFDGLELYCGGTVPKRILRDPQYISLVINTDVMDGVDLAYKCLRQSQHPVVNSEETMTVSRDVKFVISILDRCKALDIPKCFATGLMLMYLEVCEGVNVISGP